MPGACSCETRLFESPTISSGRTNSHSWKPPVKKNKAITPRGTEGKVENIRVDTAKTKNIQSIANSDSHRILPKRNVHKAGPLQEDRADGQQKLTTRNQRPGGLSAVYSSQPAMTATPAASSTAKTSDRGHDQSRLRAPPRDRPTQRSSRAKATRPRYGHRQ